MRKKIGIHSTKSEAAARHRALTIASERGWSDVRLGKVVHTPGDWTICVEYTPPDEGLDPASAIGV